MKTKTKTRETLDWIRIGLSLIVIPLLIIPGIIILCVSQCHAFERADCEYQVGATIAEAKIDDKVVAETYVYGIQLSSSGSKCLYAIRVGDTSKAEFLDGKYSQFFGPFSLNAKLYVKTQSGEWKEAIYRRPANNQEVEEFFKDSTKFYFERMIKENEVPYAVDNLDKVEFELVYFDGGAKIYFLVNTDPLDIVLIMFDIGGQNNGRTF